MSKKERILTSLMATEAELLKAAKTASKKNAVNVLKNLAAIRDVCRMELLENAYAKYGEVYDGLIHTVEQMTKVKELRSNEETFSLSGELLQYLIRETERETNFKKDIFFLPYKASMWDSLESVWKAAYEDKEHCNAYVMPIPYADLTPDGSVATWHCERDQFPKYVPTLDWKEIDLKEWHSDVIFIHNPYDDFNRVTSVEHRYYSRNLKECTDKLVYVPYFVLGEPNNWTEEQEDKIAHFILTPAVMNADLTIVQSEAMRKVYISVLSRRTNQAKEYWEKHICGTGSPKFDKVAKSKREDFKLPKEWERLLDGEKSVLYNTSLSAMLKHTDKYFQKIHIVLETFKNQQDVVLWWRPHPLMEATLRSMRPELLAEYETIVKDYRNAGWGIFDDTAELERAIACSDAYYGDWSSVVQLYEKTGKCVMIQAIEEDEGKDL